MKKIVTVNNKLFMFAMFFAVFLLMTACPQHKTEEGLKQKPHTEEPVPPQTAPGGIKIYDIQGMSHTSPYNGAAVQYVPGIVTGITYKKGEISGFYMQDAAGDSNSVTSDGIYVYLDKKPILKNIAVGDAVLVSGKVQEYRYKDEFLSITRIVSPSVKIVSSDNKMPLPVDLNEKDLSKTVFVKDLGSLDPQNEAIDFYESLEGMRVKVREPKIVASPYKDTYFIAPKNASGFSVRGGFMYNSYKGTARICMRPLTCFKSNADAGLFSGELNIGDFYKKDIVGVLSSYDNYQILPTEKLPELQKASIKEESSTIAFAHDKLNIVSYNLENFSKSDDKSHSSKKTPASRAKAFADHFVNKLKSPDIICLIEVQDDSGTTDDGTVSAEETLNLLITEIKKISGAPVYKPCSIDPENNADGGAPGANIRTAYLYRADRLELVPDRNNGGFFASDAYSVSEISVDGMSLNQNPARIGIGHPAFMRTRKPLAAHFRFTAGINGGKDFFIINNHLSSKRGDGLIWGNNQPVNRKSEKNRHEQAVVIKNFVQSVLQKRPNAAIIAAGDYNDFWFSQTIETIKSAGMKNAIEALPENDRYTYVYDGHSQTLDNILVTENIKIDYVDILHVNAEFAKKKRLSDHDPVFVQLSW